MTIRVVVAGATGWTGREVVAAILKSADLTLAGAVARKAAGRDAGEAVGLPRRRSADRRNARRGAARSRPTWSSTTPSRTW